LVWDFQLPRVHSINVSGHKYGLTYPGIGWAIWRGKDYLPEELIFNINYLGSDQVCHLKDILQWKRDKLMFIYLYV
jgi:glutamate decarboxylase